MIRVSRLNGKEFLLNAELIEQVESTPDTVIMLINGKTVMVAEPMETVLERIMSYQIRIHGLRPLSENNFEKSQDSE